VKEVLQEKPLEFKPVGSNGFVDFADLKTYAMQEQLHKFAFEYKLDGSRYHLHLRKKGGHALRSRRTSEVTGRLVDKIDRLPQFAALKLPPEIDEVILDGEVMAPGGNHAALVEIIGCDAAKAIQRQHEVGFLTMQVFDVVYVVSNGKNDLRATPFRERRQLLVEAILPHLWQTNPQLEDYLQPTPQATVPRTMPHAEQLLFLRNMYLQSLDAGYEGLMVKALESAYGHGMYKWKVHRDAVGKVTGFEMDAKGKYRGLIKSIKFSVWNKATKSWVEMGQASGMDDNLRIDISQHPKRYLNRIMEVRGQELDVQGRLRHPRFRRWRDDIDASSCTFEKFCADMARKVVV